MDDLEDPNKVLTEGIGRELKSILEKKLDSFWVARKHEEKQLHPHVKKKNNSHIKLKRGNSNINRVVFF